MGISGKWTSDEYSYSSGAMWIFYVQGVMGDFGVIGIRVGVVGGYGL